MPNKILVTGGAGQLARALVALDPSIDAPPKAALDVSRAESVAAYCDAARPDVVIHAGAVTNKYDQAVDEDYIRTNIIGTSNVVLWCMRHGARLVYLSTDYVYPGERGGYSEDAVLLPVNRYAASKLGGELAVQLYGNSLIIRTSFYTSLNFARACTDQYSSRIPLAEAAQAVLELARRADARGIINVGAPAKRSLYDIVRQEFNPDVEPCRRHELSLPYRLPPDSSMDTTCWQSLSQAQAAPSADRRACRVCGAAPLWTYLDLGSTPLANAYLREEELAQEEFKEALAIQLCESCGLSQLSKVVNPDRMFRHYLYVSSTTETIRQHFAGLAAWAIEKSHAGPGDWALDIASNDGCLLSAFRAQGVQVVGVDPAENLAAEANAAGIPTLCAYWSPALAQDVASRFAAPKIITAANVIAHVDDVHRFADGVAQCLAPRGIFVVECPYVLTFIEANEFDTAYHEHLSYMSVHALRTLVERHGLQVIDVQYFPSVHGGTIRVTSARPHDYPVDASVDRFLAKEEAFGIRRRAPYEAFAARVRQSKTELMALLHALRADGKTVWAYGASAKGNTLLNYYGVTRELVPVAIDDNPKKWGWYTPGARLRIAGIEALGAERVDYLLLLAWNFKDEIIRRCQRARYAGGFIVPVPRAELIEPAGGRAHGGQVHRS